LAVEEEKGRKKGGESSLESHIKFTGDGYSLRKKKKMERRADSHGEIPVWEGR